MYTQPCLVHIMHTRPRLSWRGHCQVELFILDYTDAIRKQWNGLSTYPHNKRKRYAWFVTQASIIHGMAQNICLTGRFGCPLMRLWFIENNQFCSYCCCCYVESSVNPQSHWNWTIKTTLVPLNRFDQQQQQRQLNTVKKKKIWTKKLWWTNENGNKPVSHSAFLWEYLGLWITNCSFKTHTYPNMRQWQNQENHSFNQSEEKKKKIKFYTYPQNQTKRMSSSCRCPVG